MTKLEQALAQAVAEENYEAAATFRDMIAEGKTDPPAEHEHNAHSLLGERGIEIFDEFIRQLRTIRKYRRTDRHCRRAFDGGNAVLGGVVLFRLVKSKR